MKDKRRRERARKRSASRRQFLFLGGGVLLGGLGLWALWGRGGRTTAIGEVTIDPSGDRLETVAAGGLPSFALSRSPRVQDAYRFAAENLDLLAFIPCYCGCRNIGHRHNGDCYVKQKYPDGRVTFNSHSVN